MGLSEHRLCTRCYVSPETEKHIFIDCSHTLKIWEKALAYMTTVFPAASTLNPTRIAIIGFADFRQCKPFLNVLEGIRLAFFKSTYLQCNRSLGDHTMIDGVKVFMEILKSLI